MTRTRFTEKQIVSVLHEASGTTTVRDVCRRHGITESTCFRWRTRYGGMRKAEVKRLNQLKDENRRLRSWWRISAWTSRW